jgi:thioredoxin
MTELLTKETFLEKVFNFEKNKEWKFEGDIPCVIDFYADWCGPCKVLSPIIQEIKDEQGNEIRVIKIDVDKNQTLSSKLNVSGIPTLMIYKKGKLLWRESGVQTKHAIISQLETAKKA